MVRGPCFNFLIAWLITPPDTNLFVVTEYPFIKGVFQALAIIVYSFPAMERSPLVVQHRMNCLNHTALAVLLTHTASSIIPHFILTFILSEMAASMFVKLSASRGEATKNYLSYVHNMGISYSRYYTDRMMNSTVPNNLPSYFLYKHLTHTTHKRKTWISLIKMASAFIVLRQAICDWVLRN